MTDRPARSATDPASAPAPAARPDIVPIHRPSLHDEVVGRVRDMIVEGRLVAGTRVHEGRLCEQLGVSRTPLREALKVLATEGLVELLPNRGAVVREVTPQDMRDMLRVLGRLEALAGELACAQASDEAIAEVKDMHERMLQHFAARNIMEYFKLNQAIHSAIVRMAGNATLQAMHETLQARVKRIRFVPHDFNTDPAQAVREHECMMDALLARDGARLGQLLKEHLDMTWIRVSKALGLTNP
jgi:DNA-binding GntR family transcriptional regulator